MNKLRYAVAAVAAASIAVTVLADNNKEAEAREFFEQASDATTEVVLKRSRAAWIFNTNITHDTQQLYIETRKDAGTITTALAREANKLIQEGGLSATTERDLDKIRQVANLPSPEDAQSMAELVEIGAELKSIYSTGKYCPEAGECLSLRDMERALSTSRNATTQLDLWQGWRQISPPMRDLYTRQVELANEGAQDIGFDDLGDYWRNRYDMSGNEFAATVERYWLDAKPMYEALQCHVEAKLTDYYGENIMPGNGMIPAHLTGNMWAQQWSQIEDIVMGDTTSSPMT